VLTFMVLLHYLDNGRSDPYCGRNQKKFVKAVTSVNETSIELGVRQQTERKLFCRVVDSNVTSQKL
jgi:hypothetical protein